MNKIRLFAKALAFALIFVPSALDAQEEELPGFNYQAVARDSEGDLITDTKISVTFQINSKEKGTMWEETHEVTTNTHGMFSLQIGTDKSLVTEQAVESLPELNWNEETYSLSVSVNDNEVGSSPILSVPVAMYGKDEDSDPNNEIQELRLTNGKLEISQGQTNIDLKAFVSSELSAGDIGVGTDSPEGVLDVKGSLAGDEPIFQVKNNDGVPVFAVYNEGVRVYIPEDLTPTKGIKGGFAVGGYNSTKALDTEDYFLKVMPHGSDISFFADDSEKGSSYTKGIKGGFAVGGYNSTKATKTPFIYMDPYAAPLNIDGGLIYLPLFDDLYEKGNCYIGTLAGANQEGHFNTAIGYQAGFNMDAVITTFPFANAAKYNTLLGGFAGFENQLGDENVYIGYQAGLKNQGSGNVFIGNQSGASYTNVSNKLIFDNDIDDPSPLIFGDFEEDYLHFNARIGVNVASNTNYALTVSNGTFVYGNIVATGAMLANYTGSPSDIRYKENINTITDALNIIEQINGVRFDWNPETKENASKEKQIGVIAQEVERVLPELVFEIEDGYKAVDYSKLTAVLIQAVKEQQSIIDQQQKDIEALKAADSVSSEEMLELMSEMQETIIKLTEKVASMEHYASNE